MNDNTVNQIEIVPTPRMRKTAQETYENLLQQERRAEGDRTISNYCGAIFGGIAGATYAATVAPGNNLVALVGALTGGLVAGIAVHTNYLERTRKMAVLKTIVSGYSSADFKQ